MADTVLQGHLYIVDGLLYGCSSEQGYVVLKSGEALLCLTEPMCRPRQNGGMGMVGVDMLSEKGIILRLFWLPSMVGAYLRCIA